MAQVQKALKAQSGLSWMNGAIAGVIGTVPMTIFMLATQRFLPEKEQYALPPEIITGELMHKLPMKDLNKMQLLIATLVSHFGYGVAMGSLYSPSAKRKKALPAAIEGALFGLVVWAASYLGLLPLLGMTESALTEPKRRNLLMAAAHIVWGASMGIAADELLPH